MRSLLVVTLALFSASAFAQYTKSAGQNAPKVWRESTVTDKQGKKRKVRTQVDAPKDAHGNAAGNHHDLAVDGAFEGQTVAVLHFYTGGGFNFDLPRAALREKGFSVYRWINAPPTPAVLEEKLKKASQLWLISGMSPRLNDEHVQVIKRFYESGKGVFLWGDNPPYFTDTNKVASALIGASMSGNVQGEQVVGLRAGNKGPGLLRGHLVTTGIQQIYEGHTIATLAPHKELKPLIYGSANNLVAALHEKDRRRLILDGGFTRLYMRWDTAGTARYVKNAAAWLANAERFGADVVAKGHVNEQ